MKVNRILGYFTNAITGAGVFLFLLWVEFFAWLRKPTDTIPVWSFYLVQLVMVVSVCVIYAYLRHRYDIGRLSTSVLVRYVEHLGKSKGWVLIVKNNPMLEINRVVSVRYQSKDNDVEEVVALGYVETKNDKGNLQIRVPEEWNFSDCELQQLGHKLLAVQLVVEKDALS